VALELELRTQEHHVVGVTALVSATTFGSSVSMSKPLVARFTVGFWPAW